MESLFEFQENILRPVQNNIRRYLHNVIKWNHRMIAIKGPRGAGKTTLMLQYLKYDLGMPNEALYVTADHSWFYTNTLYDTTAVWYRQGGRFLFIDEVHKYPNWSVELKNIYDGFPQLKIIFSASSALDIYRGEADLSRRVILYNLSGLSFREFLNIQWGTVYKAYSLDEIKKNHRDISRIVTEKNHPLPAFAQYLKYGYLPFYLEGEDTYLLRLQQVINTTLESDIAYIAGSNSGTTVKIQRLLGVIAESVPFKPNISAIAKKLDMSRDTVYQYITLLERAQLLNLLVSDKKGVASLQKPDKIYLENTNLSYALKSNPNKGNIRETFVLNQLVNAGYDARLGGFGDFYTDGVEIEVGGANKNPSQVSSLKDYILAIDDVEFGHMKRLPLWLLGFLY